MLSILGIWVAIILMGVNLGLSFEFIPPVGRRGDWFPFFLVAPAMLICAVILGFTLGSL